MIIIRLVVNFLLFSRYNELNGKECLYLEGIDPNGIVSLLQTRIPETIEQYHYPPMT